MAYRFSVQSGSLIVAQTLVPTSYREGVLQCSSCAIIRKTDGELSCLLPRSGRTYPERIGTRVTCGARDAKPH